MRKITSQKRGESGGICGKKINDTESRACLVAKEPWPGDNYGI